MGGHYLSKVKVKRKFLKTLTTKIPSKNVTSFYVRYTCRGKHIPTT